MKFHKCLIVFPCFLALSGRSLVSVNQSKVESSPRRFANVINDDTVTESIASTSPISNFISSFSYYDYYIGETRYVVADTLTSENTTSVLTIKLILSPKSYHFYNFPNLSEENAVIEFLLKDGDSLKKFYYVPTQNELSNLLAKSEQMVKGSEAYKRIVTSLNIEYDAKAKDMSPIETNSTKRFYGDVDNEAVLDHYLSTQNVSDSYITLGTKGSNIYPSVDSQIVNLIDKSIFKSDGVRTKAGYHWGYYTKTYTDSGNNKITNVLIYKVDCVKFDGQNPDHVEIYPVVTRNFKYCYDTDVVYEDAENNLCLANPTYKTALQYVTLQGDENAKKHLNPGEDGYSIQNDYGVSFASYACNLIGQRKNYVSSAEAVLAFGIAAGNVALSFATSGLSTATQLAIGAAYTIIGDLVIDGVNKKFADNISSNWEPKGDKYCLSNANLKGVSNIKDCKNNGRFTKVATIDPIAGDKFDSIYFKDSSDVLSYTTNIITGENSDDYTFAFHHQFNADVVNDNTYIFKKNPDFIGSIQDDFSYIVGRKVRESNRILEENTNNRVLYFTDYDGRDSYTLKIKNAGDYYLTFSQYPADTRFDIDNGDIQYSGSVEQERNGGQKIYLPFYKTKMLKFHFESNSEHMIRVYRPYGFGTCTINAYCIGSDFGKVYNYTSAYINNEGNSLISGLTVSENGAYTIIAPATASSTNTDTYLMLLDENGQVITKDDDGWGTRTAGLHVKLNKGTQYYLVSRMYSGSGQYYLRVFKNDFIPKMSDKVLKDTIWIGGVFRNTTYKLLTSQDTKHTIQFQAGFIGSNSKESKLNVKIYDDIYNLLVETSDLTSNSIICTFEPNRLYIIEYRVNGGSLDGLVLNLILTEK